jgi:hypothetical protein
MYIPGTYKTADQRVRYSFTVREIQLSPNGVEAKPQTPASMNGACAMYVIVSANEKYFNNVKYLFGFKICRCLEMNSVEHHLLSPRLLSLHPPTFKNYFSLSF